MCLLPSASLQSHTAALTHFQTGLRAVVRELWSLAKLHQNQTKKTTIKTSLVKSILMEKFPFLNGSLYTHPFLCRLRKMHWILTIKTVLFLKKNPLVHTNGPFFGVTWKSQRSKASSSFSPFSSWLRESQKWKPSSQLFQEEKHLENQPPQNGTHYNLKAIPVKHFFSLPGANCSLAQQKRIGKNKEALGSALEMPKMVLFNINKWHYWAVISIIEEIKLLREIL